MKELFIVILKLKYCKQCGVEQNNAGNHCQIINIFQIISYHLLDASYSVNKIADLSLKFNTVLKILKIGRRKLAFWIAQ